RRATPGPQGRLPRRGGPHDGLHRRRAGPAAGRAPAQERLRRVPSGARGEQVRQHQAARMKVTPTALPGVLVVEPKEWREPRGWLFEAYSSERYAAAGMPAHFAQDNVSWSVPGVLRGLHFQFPIGQGKLVSILEGEVYDVAVDVRPDSPTFGRWVGVVLSADNHRQLWIPDGFAHG